MKKKLNCILLIDDDDDDNYFHQIIIRDMNITDDVKLVTNGLEALDFLKNVETPPELIFLDINMPKMNGWEFLEEYNKLPADHKANTIIAMFSTSQNTDDKKKAEQFSNVKCFQSKPLTEKILEGIIDDYFQKLSFS